MIIVLFGRRDCGKTTLSKLFHKWLKNGGKSAKVHYIDSDKIRYVFEKHGESMDVDSAELHSKACSIAKYEESLNDIVLMSMPFPNHQTRKLLENHKNILWIWLDYDQSARRGNSSKHPTRNFERPSIQPIDTGNLSENESLDKIIQAYEKYLLNSLVENRKQ